MWTLTRRLLDNGGLSLKITLLVGFLVVGHSSNVVIILCIHSWDMCVCTCMCMHVRVGEIKTAWEVLLSMTSLFFFSSYCHTK